MFDNWPVGAHVIRFATGVDKHQSVCASFINSTQFKGTSAVLLIMHQMATKDGLESHLKIWLNCKFYSENYVA